MTIQNDNRRFLSKKAIENIEDIEDVKNLLLHIRDNNYSNVMLHNFSVENDFRGDFRVELKIRVFDVEDNQWQNYLQQPSYAFTTVFNNENSPHDILTLLQQVLQTGCVEKRIPNLGYAEVIVVMRV